ncbi:hypothetical protein TIFTF001_020438 [Ficus carica]|uniref:DUF1985 domain-containing protein n=1 Tax=Ficus carica TaxID=3494 RepID=A0AA88AEX1_FICCA|nr:hypothetical protein TIFTF001_020438 [Ficus carica]
MSKPTMLAEKNITHEKRPFRVMALTEKRPPAEKIPKKPAPEKKRKASEEGLNRKQGKIEVKESKKAKRAPEEKNNSDAEEVGEDMGIFSINEFCLITGMKCVGFTHLAPAVDNRLIRIYFLTLRSVSREHLELQLSNTKFENDDDAVKLGLLYMIFCITLANANSVKIDQKYFALVDNLEEFIAFSWGVLSWEATRAAICNAIENMLSSKRRPLKKVDKVHYSIAGFPHALLIWVYESILTIAGKFMTKYVKANPRMLSWTSADNVKFDAVMSALTAVDEKHPKCFVMMPTDKELNEPCVAQLYFKNLTVVPQAP